jgi:hypothetical protein
LHFLCYVLCFPNFCLKFQISGYNQ